ncbi:MAG: nitroreductase family protein [Candidatus Bathyarchaeia archaeon]|jgi:nitroreductase
MELDNCIKSRRSVRAFADKPIPKEKIEAILEAAVWAPSATNVQPWRFIIIEDESVIKLVSDKTKEFFNESPEGQKRYGSFFQTDADVVCYNAPVLVLICTEVADPIRSRLNLLDSVLAAQNMFLKAYELELGTCYMGFIDIMNQKNPDVLKAAGVPSGYEVQVPLILGQPRVKFGSGKRNPPNILNWIKSQA